MTRARRAAAGAALATALALAATTALVPRTSDGIVPTIDVAAIAQLIDQVSTLARQVQHLSGIELSMEDIVDTLGETAEVSAHRSQLDGTIDSVRRDAYADVDPDDRPDHNDPESMNAAVPGIPEFASHADAREWAVERYFVALDPSASTEFQATLHGEVDKRRKLRAEDMLQARPTPTHWPPTCRQRGRPSTRSANRSTRRSAKPTTCARR